MKFKFEKLTIWQKAMKMGEDINEIRFKDNYDDAFHLMNIMIAFRENLA